MNYFIELIEERNISVFELIKKSIRTVIQNAGGIFLATLLYALSFAFIYTLFGEFGIDINSRSTLSGSMQRFLFNLLTAVAGNYILVRAYYYILQDDGTHERGSFYVIKKIKLYISVNLAVYLFTLIMLIPLAVLFFIIPSSVYSGFSGFILLWIIVFLYIVYLFTMNGIALEYVLTDQTISESVSNALNIVTTYIIDISIKIVGLVIFYALLFVSAWKMLQMFSVTSSVISVSSISMFVNFGGKDRILQHLIAGPLLFGSILIIIILIAMFVFAMHHVTITGYYLNLNNCEGYEIIGLSKEAKLKMKKEKERARSVRR